jgi:predicted Zn-dependent protease
MADRGGAGDRAGREPRAPARLWTPEPVATAGHRAAYVVAAVVVVLLASGYGAWRWHGRASPDLAARLIADGHYRAAIRVLQEQLATTADDARLHYYLGLAYAGAGMRDGAVNQLRETVALAPREASYHQALGEAYRETGDVGRAREELEAAVRLDPASTRYEASLASLLLDLGQTEAALARLRHAVETHSREADVRLLLAEALGQAGDREGMLHEYREVVRLAAGRPLGEIARQALRAAAAEPPRAGPGTSPGGRSEAR